MNQAKLELLKRTLAGCGVEKWEIIDTCEEGWEFYLIGRRLDQHRVRNVSHVRLRVMTPADGQMGVASGEIPPTAGEAEMTALVAALKQRAGYALNPAWELNRPAEDAPAPAHGDVRVDDIAADFLRTLADMPYDGDACVNSSEVFVTRKTRRFLNSEGIDLSDTFPASMAEVVVNARDGAHEIEVYRMLRSGECDRDGLRDRLFQAMRVGQDKLKAQPTPALGRADLLLTTDAAIEVYDWYLAHLDAQYLYQGYSDWQLGRPAAGGVTGDRVTLTARRSLPNSSANRMFDDEGSLVRDRVLLRDNVPEAFYGSRQFAQYLGLRDTFGLSNVEVAGGAARAEDLRTGDYLEAVEFSDFQVDPVSGDLAGEIRLGYLHRDGRVTAVTGGSVTGSMADFVRTIRFSSERRQYDSYLIPAVTRLADVTITGA